MTNSLSLQPHFWAKVRRNLHPVHARRQVLTERTVEGVFLAGQDDCRQGAQGHGDLALGAVDQHQALEGGHLEAARGGGVWVDLHHGGIALGFHADAGSRFGGDGGRQVELKRPGGMGGEG